MGTQGDDHKLILGTDPEVSQGLLKITLVPVCTNKAHVTPMPLSFCIVSDKCILLLYGLKYALYSILYVYSQIYL